MREGNLLPGDRLPGERQLVEMLGVSRTSVRTGVTRLVMMGLLEVKAGSGTFVREPNTTAVRDVLVQHYAPDVETMQQLFELREIIESEAAARAAQRATPEQISMLRHWADEIVFAAQRKDREGLAQADVEFHRLILIATGNEILVDVIDTIAPLLHEMRQASMGSPEVLPGQRAILTAIENRDSPAARNAMLKHLAMVRKKAENDN